MISQTILRAGRRHAAGRILLLLAILAVCLIAPCGVMAQGPTPPKTVIVIPEQDVLVSHEQTTFHFEGTAVAPESTVAAVQWRNNGGAWQDAFGTDFWSFTATNLQVGPNLIEVRSRNAQGTNGLAVSKSITRKPAWGINCGEAKEITENGLYEYDLTYFPEAWHVFHAPANGLARITSTNILHRAGCNNGIGNNFGFLHSYQSPVVAQFIICEGQTILLRSTRYGNESAVGGLSFHFEPAQVQYQTTCETALEITGPGSYHFDIGRVFSNPCYREPEPEIHKGQEWFTVWYRFMPEQDGAYDFQLRQNPIGQDFSVVQTTAWFFRFPGDTCSLTCEDSIPWETEPTGGTLQAIAGETYHIALTNIYVGTYISTVHGYGVLDVTYRPLQTGVTCNEAIPITEHGIHEFNNGDGWTSDPCRTGSRTQWFSYTAPGDGVILIETCGLATFDTFISVYKGSCPTVCSGRVAINDDAAGPCGLQSRVEFAAQAGETYKIGLSGFGNDAGSGQFLIDYINMEVIVGDVVGTGTVNVSDVTELARRLANGNPPPIYVGDINGDGMVNQADVQALAEMIVNGTD